MWSNFLLQETQNVEELFKTIKTFDLAKVEFRSHQSWVVKKVDCWSKPFNYEHIIKAHNLPTLIKNFQKPTVHIKLTSRWMSPWWKSKKTEILLSCVKRQWRPRSEIWWKSSGKVWTDEQLWLKNRSHPGSDIVKSEKWKIGWEVGITRYLQFCAGLD